MERCGGLVYMTVALDLRCGGRVTQGTGHSVDRYPAGLTQGTQLSTVRGEIWRENIFKGLLSVTFSLAKTPGAGAG